VRDFRTLRWTPIWRRDVTVVVGEETGHLVAPSLWQVNVHFVGGRGGANTLECQVRVDLRVLLAPLRELSRKLDALV
jgi:N6-adenosine-specific RNA methylase IME4